MDSSQKELNIKQLPSLNKRSVFSRFILPILLLVSFIWLNLYKNLTGLSDVFFVTETYESLSSYLVFSVLFLSLFDYLVFELLFFVYRLFIGFSIYSFMIPKNVLLDKFRFWYIIRNILLGIFFNLRFIYPFISTYLCVCELIINFVLVFVLYKDLSKDYIEPLVGQYVFRTLILPVILYELYVVITQMVGVL